MRPFILFFALFAAMWTLAGCGTESSKPIVGEKANPQSLVRLSRTETERSAVEPSPSSIAPGSNAPRSNAPGNDEPKKVKPKASMPSQRLFFTPNRLLIPSVRIDAPVDPVGVLSNGQMEVPESTVRAGILSPGVKPGLPGTALIAGHVDNYTGPALFYPLKKLKPGDPLLLSNDKGQYLVYTVTSVESFKTAEAPLDRIFGHTGEARLNLITCTGKYDRKRKEHEKRLIVFTRLMQ